MDLWLKIEEKKVVTSLYVKPMALHLHIPPHSCHAPGVLPGIVFGNVIQILQFCSRVVDVTWEIKLFLHHLLDHGDQLAQLTLLFQQAMDNAKVYLQHTALDYLCAKSKKGEGQCQHVFLYLQYHPANPSSKTIQKLWHERVASPKDKPPFHRLTNDQGYAIPIDCLTIVWHRPPSLGNLLSYMKLSKHMELKVLSYVKTWFE